MKTATVKYTLFLVLALALILPGAYGSASTVQAASSCFPPPAGLTNWWPGDDNTDDIVGGQNAVLCYDTEFGTGIVEEAFVLRYPNTMKQWPGNFVEVPHEDALNLGTGDFTVSLWVYFNDTSEEQVLIEKWIQNMDGPDNNSIGWTLTKLDNNVLRLALDDYSGEIDIDSGVVSIPTHTWLHFAATRKSGIITLYMNGTQIASGVVPLDFNLDSESSLKFGHRGNIWDTPRSTSFQEFYLNGRIDEVQLFVGTALNRGFIQAIYRIGSAGLCK
ncbi:MAG: LamG domain-containing protein [Anaerolineae bacterium]